MLLYDLAQRDVKKEQVPFFIEWDTFLLIDGWLYDKKTLRKLTKWTCSQTVEQNVVSSRAFSMLGKFNLKLNNTKINDEAYSTNIGGMPYTLTGLKGETAVSTIEYVDKENNTTYLVYNNVIAEYSNDDRVIKNSAQIDMQNGDKDDGVKRYNIDLYLKLKEDEEHLYYLVKYSTTGGQHTYSPDYFCGLGVIVFNKKDFFNPVHHMTIFNTQLNENNSYSSSSSYSPVFSRLYWLNCKVTNNLENEYTLLVEYNKDRYDNTGTSTIIKVNVAEGNVSITDYSKKLQKQKLFAGYLQGNVSDAGYKYGVFCNSSSYSEDLTTTGYPVIARYKVDETKLGDAEDFITIDKTFTWKTESTYTQEVGDIKVLDTIYNKLPVGNIKKYINKERDYEKIPDKVFNKDYFKKHPLYSVLATNNMDTLQYYKRNIACFLIGENKEYLLVIQQGISNIASSNVSPNLQVYKRVNKDLPNEELHLVDCIFYDSNYSYNVYTGIDGLTSINRDNSCSVFNSINYISNGDVVDIYATDYKSVISIEFDTVTEKFKHKDAVEVGIGTCLVCKDMLNRYWMLNYTSDIKNLALVSETVPSRVELYWEDLIVPTITTNGSDTVKSLKVCTYNYKNKPIKSKVKLTCIGGSFSNGNKEIVTTTNNKGEGIENITVKHEMDKVLVDGIVIYDPAETLE